MAELLIGRTSLNTKAKFWNRLWLVLLAATICLLILKLFFFQQMKVIGASMDPNYHTDDLILVSKFNKKLERGQVVSIFSEQDKAKTDNPLLPQTALYLKRIVALGGESIEMIDDQVIIYNQEHPSGQTLEENYLSSKVKQQMLGLHFYFPKTQIPEDSYFCLGDNRPNSLDSRVLGPIGDYAIFGEEALRAWPIDKAGLFDLPKYQFAGLSANTKDNLLLARESYKQELAFRSDHN